jgi:hypothetical protein
MRDDVQIQKAERETVGEQGTQNDGRQNVQD